MLSSRARGTVNFHKYLTDQTKMAKNDEFRYPEKCLKDTINIPMNQRIQNF